MRWSSPSGVIRRQRIGRLEDNATVIAAAPATHLLLVNHYVIPVGRAGLGLRRSTESVASSRCCCPPAHSGDFSVTPLAVNFTDSLCFCELRRIPGPGTRDKSCLAPRVRVMALCKTMPSDARPNFKTGCVGDKAAQQRHPHSSNLVFLQPKTRIVS